MAVRHRPFGEGRRPAAEQESRHVRPGDTQVGFVDAGEGGPQGILVGRRRADRVPLRGRAELVEGGFEILL
ncbi:MAG: hypothetical protein DMH00_10545 [Acidobacteria bacterium]|nr:MAG: hypothetical protein DMH00_10545 [Acidobacteriota bacterium]